MTFVKSIQPRLKEVSLEGRFYFLREVFRCLALSRRRCPISNEIRRSQFSPTPFPPRTRLPVTPTLQLRFWPVDFLPLSPLLFPSPLVQHRLDW